MPVIRFVQVSRFRGIRHAVWAPCPGINAIIGAGDTGKSTLLDAIEMTLAPRRNMSFSDADFWSLDVSEPIDIRVTIGDLPDTLLDFDRYGSFQRGWHSITGLSDEPTTGSEVVITIRLHVDQDLDPRWCLYSDRADADGQARELPSAERQRLAPVRLGVLAHHHLAWGNRSVLNKITEAPLGAGSALADAARQARSAFGDAAQAQVQDAITIVRDVANRTGIAAAANATALLDAHGISFTGGAIALHDGDGVPLRNLGTGSSRLLIAGVQAAASNTSPFLLIDEVEHGLEPYRIIRLLHTLGSKQPASTRQVFLTTHSAVVIRELAARQIWRAGDDGTGQVILRQAGATSDEQATLRACAEAFLAPKVIVCEGPTEIGLLRGLDLHWDTQGYGTFGSYGAAMADGGGGSMITRSLCFAALGYRTCLLRDSDIVFTPQQLGALAQAGVTEFFWDAGLSTEQQLCMSLPDQQIEQFVQLAVEEQGKDKVEADLRNRAAHLTVDHYSAGLGISVAEREFLGLAAKKGGWFKNITLGERVGREILAPNLAACSPSVTNVINALGNWTAATH
jgi:putative ATP-dependent endonuclease of OLD family